MDISTQESGNKYMGLYVHRIEFNIEVV